MFDTGGVAQLAGFSMLKGHGYHCQLDPGFRLTRKEIRAFLAPLLNRRGFLTTRVPIGDEANERFNRAFSSSAPGAMSGFTIL